MSNAKSKVSSSYNEDVDGVAAANQVPDIDGDSDLVSDDEDDQPESKMLFQKFLKALEDRIKAARRKQLTSHVSQTRAEHDQYWQTFYQQVQRDAAAGLIEEPSVPWLSDFEKAQPFVQNGACFEPPCHKLGVVFGFREEAGDCPCCMGDHTPDFVISTDDPVSTEIVKPESSAQGASGQGVTFDMLIAGISEFFHGKDDGTPGSFGLEDQERPVVHSISYMNADGVLLRGNLYIYVDDCATGLASIGDADENASS